MNVKQYLRAVSTKDGPGLVKDARKVIEQLSFKPAEIVIADRFISEPDRMDEALAWLDADHPGVTYSWEFDGLDWFFEDALLAFEFKLRWC